MPRRDHGYPPRTIRLALHRRFALCVIIVKVHNGRSQLPADEGTELGPELIELCRTVPQAMIIRDIVEEFLCIQGPS